MMAVLVKPWWRVFTAITKLGNYDMSKNSILGVLQIKPGI
jgi:hypothetical protein